MTQTMLAAVILTNRICINKDREEDRGRPWD